MNTPVIPLVSVWVITYNHADFIRKCLEGILSQKTTFPYEVCIGEDQSSDGTREICQEYAVRYPKIVRLFLRDRNDPARAGCVGAWQFNFIETFKACRGEFIAMCDGDDFWSDPFKLQKQVDFLRQNPNCSGCFHKIGRVDENGRILCADAGYPPARKDIYSLDDLLRYSTFSPLLSVIFRNHPQVAPEWTKKAPFGDIIVHAGNLRRGDYGFIDEIMGYYRIHQGGLASGSSRLKNVWATIETYHLMGNHFGFTEKLSYRQGLRALRFSYAAEKLMATFVPDKLKKQFDTAYGAKIRGFVRRMLVRGR